MADYGQDLVDRGLEILKGSWEYDGEKKDLLVEDISYPDFKLAQQYGVLSARFQSLEDADPDDIDEDELAEQVESLDDFSWESEDEDKDFVVTMVENKLVKPNANPESLPTSMLRALVEGMMETWQESEDVATAKEEMPLEGNR